MREMDGGASPLSRLRDFLLPEGGEAIRKIRAIRNTQRGEMRTGPRARWVPFASEETIEAARTSFRWDARLEGEGAGAALVADAYEDGHGWGAVRSESASALGKVTGPEFDRGELQRYLASLPLCPLMLLANDALVWEETSAVSLRLRDRTDRTGAVVEIELAEDGSSLSCRAERPRTVGKEIVSTPWSTTAGDFREWEGMRIAYGLEAAWHPAEGSFLYFRSAVTSFVALS